MNEIKARYFAAMAAAIERHGGKVEKYIGDAIMAVFGPAGPRGRRDPRVQAAADMGDALRVLNEEFERDYGVHADGPDRRQHRRGRRGDTDDRDSASPPATRSTSPPGSSRPRRRTRS